MRAALLVTIITALAVGISACGGLSATQRDAAGEALAALEKLQGATEVGVTNSEYRAFLQEAKAKVNRTASVLPDGALREELNQAMEAYEDAAVARDESLVGVLFEKMGPGEELIPKYDVPFSGAGEAFTYPGRTALADVAVQLIWAVASEHVDEARRLASAAGV